jgi:flavin reductase (DIM6/NTAB) family NADH-FMN oxidoreductase RutF
MKEFDVADIEARRQPACLKTAVTPCPIAWVSTVSESGHEDLAPISFFSPADPNPPVVMINLSRKNDAGDLKDTTQNILDTEEFAINIVTEANLDQMDHTSKVIPADESEFDLTSIERADCRMIAPFRVSDAAIAMECTLYDGPGNLRPDDGPRGHPVLPC